MDACVVYIAVTELYRWYVGISSESAHCATKCSCLMWRFVYRQEQCRSSVIKQLWHVHLLPTSCACELQGFVHTPRAWGKPAPRPGEIVLSLFCCTEFPAAGCKSLSPNRQSGDYLIMLVHAICMKAGNAKPMVSLGRKRYFSLRLRAGLAVALFLYRCHAEDLEQVSS